MQVGVDAAEASTGATGVVVGVVDWACDEFKGEDE